MPRIFFMTRGVAGCGKSTFLHDNRLDPYTVSSDKIRLLLSSPEHDETGKLNIAMKNPKAVWDMVYSILESRFAQGATTILDATNLKAKDIKDARNRAQKHRYRVYIIDFTDIPEEEIYRRNANRPELNRVPEHVIARQLNIARTSEVPGGVTVLTRQEALDMLRFPYLTKIVLQNTKYVNVIGDVHGCASALYTLMEKIGDVENRIKITAPTGPSLTYTRTTIDFPLPRKDEKYVFLGDLLDRGIENAHVFAYIYEIVNRGYDISILEGNHEKWIRLWGENAAEFKSDEFRTRTLPQLKASGASRKQARKLASKFGQYLYFEVANEKRFFVNHGGLSCLPDPFASVSASELIHGSGDYDDVREVNAYWERSAKEHGVTQIHGHRNWTTRANLDVFVSDHAICLEGGVEHGGYLRAVRIDAATGNVEDVSVENHVFWELPVSENISESSIKDIVEALRANRNIKEKKLEGHISSFNFTREAFAKKRWDSQTTHARGLFIDTENMRVKARSYDKFFAIGERDETRLETLAKTLDFPVVAYAKENGYLGICSHNSSNLFCASKSTNEGMFATRFETILHDTLKDKTEEFARYLEENDLSAVFEVIDPENDYHMVRYTRPVVILLTLIKNQMHFEQLPYDNVVDIANRFGLEVKSKAYVIKNANELMDWYSTVKRYDYLYNGYKGDGYGNADGDLDHGYHIEGFVLEDSSNNMVKVKSDWYQFWKFFRGVARDVSRKGSSAKINRSDYIKEMNGTPDADAIYAFIKEYLDAKNRNREKDTIELDFNGNPNIIKIRQIWETLL